MTSCLQQKTYSVPYDGSEVLLHWANKDQHYIKTTANFSHFSFDPRKAIEKDASGTNRQLFDDAGAVAALKVCFQLVDATEGAHNNVKVADKDERFFLLDGEHPIEWLPVGVFKLPIRQICTNLALV